MRAAAAAVLTHVFPLCNFCTRSSDGVWEFCKELERNFKESPEDVGLTSDLCSFEKIFLKFCMAIFLWSPSPNLKWHDRYKEGPSNFTGAKNVTFFRMEDNYRMRFPSRWRHFEQYNMRCMYVWLLHVNTNLEYLNAALIKLVGTYTGNVCLFIHTRRSYFGPESMHIFGIAPKLKKKINRCKIRLLASTFDSIYFRQESRMTKL